MSIVKTNNSLDSHEIFSSFITNSKEWNILKFEDVLELITYGLTVRPKYVEQGIPLLSATQIKDHNINFLSAPKISLDDYNDLSDKCKLRIGDILFSKTGTIGSCAICNQEQEIAIAQNVARLVFNKKIVDLGYVFYYLRSPFIQNLSQERAKGNAIKDLQLGEIRQFPIPLPPLEEQKRIAAILDKADRVRRKRQEAIRLTEELGRSIFLDMFGDPVTNPKGWETKKLSELTDVENGDRSSNYPSGSDVLSEGILFLSTKNIVNSSLNLEQKQCISKEKFDSLSRGKLKQGDIVITLRGTLGNCCIFESSEDAEGFINAQLMIIRVKNALNNHFLHTLIISIPMNKYLQSLGTGAAVPQLTAQQIKNLDIIHPPISSQQDFLAVKHRSIKLYSQNQKHFYESENLFNSLLQRAFRGEL